MALKTTETNVRTATGVPAPGQENRDTNPDPITGAPGAHPTGIGAAAGGITGAVAGLAGGPVGAAIGAVAGAVVGGYAGKAAGEWNDPTAEEAYWRENYTARPYYQAGETFDLYAPAYAYGAIIVQQHPDRQFSEVEDDIRAGYEDVRKEGEHLPYHRARAAIEDAYTRSAEIRAERLRDQRK